MLFGWKWNDAPAPPLAYKDIVQLVQGPIPRSNLVKLSELFATLLNLVELSELSGTFCNFLISCTI